MDTTLLTSLTTLETALTSLTESITTHAPSLPITTTLLNADADLTKNLSHLKQHTENILLLAHLHSLAAHLAETYKQQVKTLSDIRSEILRVNISGPSSLGEIKLGDEKSDARRSDTVDYKALLSFARSVSRFTAPRGFKTPSVLRAEAEARVDGKGDGEGMSAVGQRNAGGTTNGIEPVVNGVQGESVEVQGQERQEGSQDRNPAMESLAPDIKAWLDPQLQVPFLPWPSEEMVARSGLARVSGWVGAVGVEDDGVAAEQAREAEEEAQRRKDEEQRVAAARYDEYEQQQVRSAPKPKVFTGLDLYDPDEE